MNKDLNKIIIIFSIMIIIGIIICYLIINYNTKEELLPFINYSSNINFLYFY